jgi:hypothetical protein
VVATDALVLSHRERRAYRGLGYSSSQAPLPPTGFEQRCRSHGVAFSDLLVVPFHQFWLARPHLGALARRLENEAFAEVDFEK